MKRKVLLGTVISFALVVAAAGAMYAFGTPQTGSTEPISLASEIPPSQFGGEGPAQMGGGAGGSAPSGKPARGVVPEGAQAPPADPNTPLAIQIPGCKCHSDDPKLVKQHEKYRMNQCAGCHSGG